MARFNRSMTRNGLTQPGTLQNLVIGVASVSAVGFWSAQMTVEVYRFARGRLDEKGGAQVSWFMELSPSVQDAMESPFPTGVLLSYISTAEGFLRRAEGDTAWTLRPNSLPPWLRNRR